MTLTSQHPDKVPLQPSTFASPGQLRRENAHKGRFKKYAETLRAILAAAVSMSTTRAATELMKREPNCKKDLGNMKFGAFVTLYHNLFELQTLVAGGVSEVRLKPRASTYKSVVCQTQKTQRSLTT